MSVSKDIYSLGLFYLFHDSSACLLKNGEIVAMAEEERFNRRKHSYEMPIQSIRFCLETAQIPFARIDQIAYGFRPMAFLGHQVKSGIRNLPKSLNLFVGGSSYMPITKKISGMLNVAGDLRKHFGPFKAKVCYVDHHDAHAYSTFLAAAFPDAAIMIADGFGETSATNFYIGSGTNISRIHRVPLPHSLGVYYAAITQFLGFRPNGDEYKVMGMTAFGKDVYSSHFADILHPVGGLNFELNTDYIDLYTHGVRKYCSDKFAKVFGPPRQYGAEYEQKHFDIAHSAQKQLERTVIEMVRSFQRQTGLKNLCLAGGVAQNVLMNRRLLDECGFEQVFVPPVAYDGGISFGAALAVYHREHAGAARPQPLTQPNWGPKFSDKDCFAAMQRHNIVPADLSFDDFADRITDSLMRGDVVGYFNGGMEIGPRALGYRSILADPRRKDIVDILNARIKRREFFRPFAPMVPLEDCEKYFDLKCPSPFMTTIARVKNPDLLPGITHVDGTARVQTVTAESNPEVYRILKSFGAKTGVPILINTSFNENEPIVCTPDQAIECFSRTQMDMLVFNGRYIVEKVAMGSGVATEGSSLEHHAPAGSLSGTLN